ncbi:MAG: hypothetical protein H8E80_04840 [Desulfobacteraceae bacterium]|uniref:Uncharacterized protein n=1 Tax=Candidatus Desulfaltia bathyphila TaxID=2841697 RepID=A0A8J6N4V4_9BACT|nr:hypothetical protein [Candidatus Desulfaltia bathyphila]
MSERLNLLLTRYVISENTFQKISDQKIAEQIDIEALPPVKIKGVDEPIMVYRVNV